jgi:hypothetical protein
MDFHSGTWQVAAAGTTYGYSDPADLVFASAAAVDVLFTAKRASNSDQYPLAINVHVNGALAPNGAMAVGEAARTFRFAGVTSIQVVAGAVPAGYQSLSQSGEYQITIL